MPLVDPELANTLANQDNSTFSNILRFLGRPGYAFRALLAGEPVDALENIAQGIMDLPTGGFIDRRLSLANFFDDDGDITDRSERREFTNLLEDWGAGSPAARGYWTNLGLDIGGGLLTDPLTLLTGPTKGIAQGSLSGMARPAAQKIVREALEASPAGLKALRGASDDISRNFVGPLNGPIEDFAAEQVFGKAMGRPGFAFAEQTPELKRAVEDLAEHVDVMGPRPNSLTTDAANVADAAPKFRAARENAANAFAQQTAELDSGIRALRESGMIGPGTGVRWAGIDLPNAWVHTGRFATLPGLVREGLLSFDSTKPIAHAAEVAAEASWDWLRGGLYDKKLSGKVPEAIRYAARETDAKKIAADRRTDRVSRELFEAIPEDSRKGFGEILLRHESDLARRLWAHAAEPDVLLGKGPDGKDIFTRPPAPDAGQAIAQFKDEVTQLPGVTPDTVDRYIAEMAQVREDLKAMGVFKDLKGLDNPLYIPHQASPILGELIEGGFKDKVLAGAVKDVFAQRRSFRTNEEFTARLEQIAAQFGINTEGLAIQNTDIADLFRRRMFAHSRTVARAELTSKARNLGMVENDPVSLYLKNLFAPTSRDAINPLPLRKLSEFLGGSQSFIKVDVTNSSGAQAWAKRFDPKKSIIARRLKTDVNGSKFVEIGFPGVNYFYKAPLTSASGVAFHFRNMMSSVVMGAFDEDIGIAAGGQALKALWHSGMNLPLVQKFTKSGYKPNEISDAVKALSSNPAERAEAVTRLMASGRKVGPYGWDEVVKILDGAIPERVSVSDIDQAIGRIDAFGRDLVGSWTQALRNKDFTPALRNAFQQWTDLGFRAASSMESHFRASAMVRLLEKGIDPIKAAEKVNRAFVNYDVNSLTERFLRDVIPFLRFQIGSAAWAKTIANKPRLVNWMGNAKGSAENSLGDEGLLPERARESLGLPLPWRDEAGNMEVLVSLGLPQEVAMNMIATPTPTGFRRNVLGGMQPLLRLPFEATVGKSMFWGEDFGQFRKAPGWLPAAFTREVQTKNGVRYEIDGRINEIINALPTSRMDGMLNKLLDENKPLASTLLGMLTGARTMTVDSERELRNRLSDYLKERAADGTVGSTLVYFARGEVPPDIQAALDATQELKKPKKRGMAF